LASQINASNSGFGGIVSTGDSSGVLQLQTAGTAALTIDTSQNVGIGNTSPSYPLDLSTAQNGTLIRGGENSSFSINNYAGEAHFSSGMTLNTAGQWTARNTASADIYLNGTGNQGFISFCTNTGLTIGNSVSPVDRFRINSDGSLSSVIPSGSTLYPAYMARAWVNFNGTGTVAIRASGNVTSITDNGTGDYTINFTNAMPDVNYNVVGSAGQSSAATGMDIVGRNLDNSLQTVSAVRIYTLTTGNSTRDNPNISVAIFR
jgi:hypothetical protein